LQSRYYNPDWGRFVNADYIGGKVGVLLSHNIFLYCKNNPVNMQDEDGDRPSYIGETSDDVETSVKYVAKMLKVKYNDYDLGKGYTARVNRPHVETDQPHVHVEKNGKEVANQNEDGTPHHPNKNVPGEPPKSVKKKLKEKSGWDWDGSISKASNTDDVTIQDTTPVEVPVDDFIPIFP